jgi:hypothetical protein
MAFPKSVQTNWIVKSLAGSGKHTSQLLPFQLAIVDNETHNSVSISDAQGRPVYLALGSPNQGQQRTNLKIDRLKDPLNSTVSFKSQPISQVSQIVLQKHDKDTLSNVYYLGYNGLHDCKTLEFECGKTYSFQVHASGRPVRTLFGQEMTEIISVSTDCCPTCEEGDCDTSVDCSTVVDRLVAEFNDENRWLSRFYTAERVMSCTTEADAPTKTQYEKYCLTLCDNGDELDLAAVQNSYPTLVVSVKERNAPYTTYEFTQLASESAPASFTQQPTIVAACDGTCPSGYTAVPSGYAYIVEIDNSQSDTSAGAQLTAVQAVWATATYAEKTNFESGTSTYYIVSSAAITQGSGDNRIVSSLGATEMKCQLTTALTTVWELCKTGIYKITRDLILIKGVDDCSGTSGDASPSAELVALQAAFSDLTDVVADSITLDASSTDCLLKFNISQYSSNLMEDGCDTVGYTAPQFDDLPTWDGFHWEVDPCASTDSGNDDCKCGIKFTAVKFVDSFLEAPIYDMADFDERDPVMLSIGLLIMDGPEQSVCTNNIPDWIQTQRANFRTLKGRDVMKEIVMEGFYRQQPFFNMVDKENLLLLQREGLKYGVKLEDYYFAIRLSHNQVYNMNATNHFNQFREEIVLFIHEDDVTLFETLRAALTGAFPTALVKSFV